MFNEINNFTHANTQEGLEIPFIVWCSERFKEKHFEKYKSIQNAKHKPFMTDDLIHTILDLCDIESKDYDKKEVYLIKTMKKKGNVLYCKIMCPRLILIKFIIQNNSCAS